MTLLSLLHPLISPDYVSWLKTFPLLPWSSLVFTLLKVMLIIALFFLKEPLLTLKTAGGADSIHSSRERLPFLTGSYYGHKIS